MYTFYLNYYVYLCVYSKWWLFKRIYAYLCVYIVMCNYLCLFLTKCVKLWAYIFTEYLKCAKRLIKYLSS